MCWAQWTNLPTDPHKHEKPKHEKIIFNARFTTIIFVSRRTSLALVFCCSLPYHCLWLSARWENVDSIQIKILTTRQTNAPGNGDLLQCEKREETAKQPAICTIHKCHPLVIWQLHWLRLGRDLNGKLAALRRFSFWIWIMAKLNLPVSSAGLIRWFEWYKLEVRKSNHFVIYSYMESNVYEKRNILRWKSKYMQKY